MKKLTAFVARSFHKDDQPIVGIFSKYLDSFRKLGLDWVDAEEPESRSIAEKVKAKLADKQVFIGLFTKRFPIAHPYSKQFVQDHIPWYSRLLFRKREAWATSGWTIEECGFAIGKQMNLILLVEEGVIDVGGLHGDHEIIMFSRGNPEACIPQLNAQLTRLLAQEVGPETEEAVPTSPERRDESGKEEPFAEREKTTTARNYIQEIIEFLFENDENRARKVLDEWLSEARSDEEKVYRRVHYHHIRAKAGFSDAFIDVQGLSKEFPDHPAPFSSLGWLLKDLGELAAAAENLIAAASRHSKATAKSKFLVEAATCLSKNKEQGKARKLLENALPGFASDPEALLMMYKGLADVAEAEKHNYFQLAMLEKALALQPMDHDLRFRIAHKYAEIERHAMALYHYLILTAESPGGGNLNNLGVVYMNLKIKGKAVESYKKAADFDETLAMANLAYHYLEHGLLDEAAHIVERAFSKANFHPNVASARARLEKVREEEDEKEKEVLKNVDGERRFRIALADAICKRADVPVVTGKWRTPYGDIDIKTRDGLLEGFGKSTETEQGLRLNEVLLGVSFPPSPPIQINKTIRLDGKLEGAAGFGKITIETEGRTILGGSKQELEIQFIVSSESKIDALQMDEKGLVSIVSLNRLNQIS